MARAVADARADGLAAVQVHRSRLPTFLYLLSFSRAPGSTRGPATFRDYAPYILYALGFLSAFLSGGGQIAIDLIYGLKWTDGLTGPHVTHHSMMSASRLAAGLISIVGLVQAVLTWAFLTCFSAASHLMSMRLQHAYVASVLSQDATYFDIHGPGEIATRAGKDINLIRIGWGEKIAYLIWASSTLVAAIISAFCNADRMAGVLFSLIPFLIIAFSVIGYFADKVTAPALRLEGLAGNLVEQAISSVRIVQAFSMRQPLLQKLNNDYLRRLARLGVARAFVKSTEVSVVYFVIFIVYSLGVYYAGITVEHGKSVGQVLTAFWNSFNSLFALANVAPHIPALLDAHSSLQVLRNSIERVPYIDVRDPAGLKPSKDELCAPQAGQPDAEAEAEPDTEPKAKAGAAPLPSRARAGPAVDLRNVTFAYPSRPNIASLKDVTLHVPGGRVTALVGPSGSGKSTIASLLLREYDPSVPSNPADQAYEVMRAEEARKQHALDGETEAKPPLWKRLRRAGSASAASTGGADADEEKTVADETLESRSMAAHAGAEERIQGSGEVLFGGYDVRQLNLRWLRSQVAVVQQNPSIFTCSVFENVAAGLTGTEWEYFPDLDGAPDAPPERQARRAVVAAKVKEALIKAQAYDFVANLPEGWDTLVSGGRTGVLSGGQRQRIAIARALIKQPLVLLMDEATSALDSATEEKIKLMLEHEQNERGMTCITIAHRLSTVKNADKIVVIANGEMVDEGTHDDLMDPKRANHVYRNMVNQQMAMVHSDALGTASDEAETKKERTVAGDELDKCSTHCGTPAQTDIFSEATTLPTAPMRPPVQMAASHMMPDPAPINKHDFAVQIGRNTATTHPATFDPSFDPTPVSDEGASAKDADPAQLPQVGVWGAFKTLVYYISLHPWQFFIGFVASLGVGTALPVSAWMVGKAVGFLSIEGDDKLMRHETQRWALWFFVLAIVTLVVCLVASFFLENVSESMSRVMRSDALAKLLDQEVGFFDAEGSGTGGLTTAVANHPTAVAAASGAVLFQVLNTAANVLGGVIMTFVMSWKMAVVVLSPIVLLLISGWLNVVMLQAFETRAQQPLDRAASYIAENMDSIRTVAALGREAETMRVFARRAKADKSRTVYLLAGSLGFSLGNSMVYFVSGIGFFWGGHLLASGQLSLSKMYAGIEGAFVGAFSAGKVLTYVPDYGRAFASLRVLTAWAKRTPRIAHVELAKPLSPADLAAMPQGDIVFDHVEMRYPMRPKHPALRDLCLTLKAGQTTAFCGPSGSGKSSILALLQRYYDPAQGAVLFNGIDSRSVPLTALRSRMAYVSQDAVLFSGSIFWNLSLGANEPEKVTQAQVEEACREAHILDFVRGLPDGFDSDIGYKGAQLSGGQKQRLCIARALMRNPDILILDEATSALDTESEASVQAALDRAARGRTTCIIAHRLSTIRHAHTINVIEDGVCVESGSHDELLARQGRYYELIEAQL